MNEAGPEIDWSSTTWEGSRRAQLRHALGMTIRERLEAMEGLADVARRFQQMRERGKFKSVSDGTEGPQSEPALAVRAPVTQYGSGESRHEVVLDGCTPEPLMSYLKALGILRIVGEQMDPHARGFWDGSTFRLVGNFGKEALVGFLLQQFRPTPIVVPWSGNDFFAVKPDSPLKRVRKTPTGAQVIEAFLANQDERLSEYRSAITTALEALKVSRIDKKEQLGKADVKAAYIGALRSQAGSRLVEWIDAAAVIGRDKATFSSLLGSGGGSDGNTHFSDNYMQNLWEMLPEFGYQRTGEGDDKSDATKQERYGLESKLLQSALFGTPAKELTQKRTSSLFDSGAVGGPNATQGVERESLTNPWNFILGLEGAILFAGAISKRAQSTRASTSFPFQFQFSPTYADRAVSKEQTGREIWLPLWAKPTGLSELRLLLGEGRAEIRFRAVNRGVDMARAATGLGVDRGLAAFQRFGILKGRVGGDNYNTAVGLGRFDVHFRGNGDLLQELDLWLDRFRSKCAIGRKDEAPSRIVRGLSGIDSAIFDYCRYGGTSQFQQILIALGKTERELMRDRAWADKNRVSPISGLSPHWIAAADDGSVEFELASSLATVHDAERKLGPLRANLEPVQYKNGRIPAEWADKDQAVVWNAADTTRNLGAVLARRIMDGNRAGCEQLPLAYRRTASLESIAEFLAGATDNDKVEELLWGLMLIDWIPGERPHRSLRLREVPPLDRIYALLKLLFLSRPIVAERDRNGNLRWRYAKTGERGIDVRPEPRIVPLLLSGRTADACEIATRRLLSSGLSAISRRAAGPHTQRLWDVADDMALGTRLAASLLIPIDSRSVDRLAGLVTRSDEMTEPEPIDPEEEAA